MMIDTEIRHVTKPGANLFLELGFSPAEAKRLQAVSRRQINDERAAYARQGAAKMLALAGRHLDECPPDSA